MPKQRRADPKTTGTTVKLAPALVDASVGNAAAIMKLVGYSEMKYMINAIVYAEFRSVKVRWPTGVLKKH